MTPEKALEVIGHYRSLLQHMPPTQGPFDDSPSPREALSHLHGMFDAMEEMLKRCERDFSPTDDRFWEDPEGREEWEKVNRWLGFVQGVLWLHGDYTLDQMREHNRCAVD